MIDMTASISEGDVARFNSALSAFSTALGREAQTAPRRAAIQLCVSFRAHTKVAHKRRQVRALPINGIGGVGMKYHNKWVSDPKRRLTEITFPERGIDSIVLHEYVQCSYPRHGGLQREANRRFGTSHWRGFAKRSWGWVMHNIYNGAAPDAPWQRRMRDGRNPMDLTRESTSRSSGGMNTYSGYARICNRVEYAEAALKISIGQATRNASTWMMKQVERKLAWKGGKR